MAENTIDNLSIQVVASAERAISTFNRLASGASGLRGAVRGAAGGMQDMAQAAKDAGTATQEAGTQSGEASSKIGKFWDALRGVGSGIGGFFTRAVHRGTAAVGTFLKSIARIAFYRIIRSIIKDLGQSFRDLYGYSRLFGTDFAKSMDRITTASVYLRNSLAAMVAPLVNLFAPALDMLADKIVDILNFVNQLFAAINGQETYTVAKKVATTWESTFDSAANHANKRIKEVRNTLLGFDEINRLNGETPTTSGSTGSSPYTPGYSTMFEEKPLEGFFEKISNVTSGWPDWLKWLLGGTALVGGFLLIKKFIPWLIKKIGELFAFKIPDWIKWLFGPKGDNDIGLDIPDKIDLPDADVPVNLKQGDWSVLQQIPTEKYLLLKVGVKMDGWLGNGNPQLPSNQPLVIDDDGSGTWDFTFQQAAMGANNLQAINNQLENMVDNWDDLAWEVAKMASGKVIDRTLRVAVKRSDSWDKTAWDAANLEDSVINRTVNVDIRLLRTANDLWKIFKEAWDKENRAVGFVIKTASSANGHWDVFKKAWDKENRTVGFLIKTASSAKGHWDNFKKEWDKEDCTVGFLIKTASSANGHWNVFKKEWDSGDRKVGFTIKTASTADGHWNVFKKTWDAGDRIVGFIIKTASSADGHWNTFKKAWDKEDHTVGFLIKTASTANGHWNTFKKEWDADDRKVGFIITTASSATGHWNVFKKEWDEENRAVGFIIKTASSANGHWDTFKKAWVAEDRKVGFIITTASSANGHWDVFKKEWVDGNRKVGFIITTASSADGHWGVFKKAWVDGDRKVGFSIKTASTADGHWNTFKKAWDAGDRTVYVDVQLKKKDWTTVTDFVDDSFGGATGGGGKTKGGGAGRSIGVGVKLQENTADKGSKSLWDMWWGIFNKTLEIEQDIIIKAVGGKGIKRVGNDKNALNDFSPSTVTVNSKPGNGFTGKLSGTNTYTLKGIEDTSVKVGAAPSWASTIGGLVPYLQIDNLSTAIKALAKKGWGTKTFKGAVGASDTTTSITANLSKNDNWTKAGGALKYLGLQKSDGSPLTATIKTKLEKTENNEVTYSFSGGGSGKAVMALKFKKYGGVFSNGQWSDIPQYANGTTNAHGSLFLAGEAGPEIVGHVGGRTEVLNKSQLASAMFSAVQAAMAPAAANFASAAQSMGVADAGVDMETLAEMIRQGVEQAMARSNDYDRQKVALLQQINEKDYNPEISTSSINRAQQRMNRRAGTTIVPVGT